MKTDADLSLLSPEERAGVQLAADTRELVRQLAPGNSEASKTAWQAADCLELLIKALAKERRLSLVAKVEWDRCLGRLRAAHASAANASRVIEGYLERGKQDRLDVCGDERG